MRPEQRARFESAYGPAGDWAALFARAPGYLGTELIHVAADEYLTVDRWRSEEDFARFEAAFAEEYRALDAACETLTLCERKIGRYAFTAP